MFFPYWIFQKYLFKFLINIEVRNETVMIFHKIVL